MAGNSFLGPIDELRFGTYEQTDVAAALDTTEKLAWERLNTLLALADSERTFANTVLALTRATDEFDAVGAVVSHLESVLGEPWRAADEAASERATDLGSEIGFHQGLYQALVAYRDQTDEVKVLPLTHTKLLHELIRDYERNGVNLPDKTIAELKELRLKLSAASIKFGQNSVNASDEACLWLDEEALDGVDTAFIAQCREAAVAEHKPGLKLGYSQPNYARVMSGCRVRATRRAFYDLHNRLAAGTNEAVMKQILELRRQLAQLLGFATYADLVLEDRMAHDGPTAQTFIDGLADRYRHQSELERDTLQAFAQTLDSDPELQLEASDLDSGLDMYYADKMREQQIGLSEQSLKPYFQLEAVVNQMFLTLGTLYGVTFKASDAPGWYDGVQAYDIYDADSHHLASVWCDWISRKGKKSGAWMNQFYVADRANNSFAKPHLGYVTCNFSPATGTEPVLLSFREVETIWHEFGHFMHAALGRPGLPEQSMMSCRWDFVEAPSQIMENWVWVPEVLSAMAKHYKTGEPLPSEATEKLLASRRFHVATKAMRQYALAATDLAVHINYDPQSNQSVSQYAQAVKQRYLAVPTLPRDVGLNSFNHIFAGGYGSAYYSYKWAEVIEADLFSKFEAEGPLNPAVGAQYRDKVLARGAEVEPAELVSDFLGRASNSDALLQRDGISS